MTITEYPQGDFFGGHLDYITFTPKVKSSKVLVFHPGTQEMGVGDGSQLYELYKYGYPKLAKAGYEFPFNIVAIQPNTSYSSVSKCLLPWIQMEFKPSAIIPIGISLGAISCCDLLAKDRYGLITGVVSLSGKGNPLSVPNMRAVPGYAYHGDQDTTVSYSEALKFYNTYNSYFSGKGGFKLNIAAGVGHSGWDNVMSVTSGQDDLLQWIIQQFGSEPVGTTYEDGYNDAKSKILDFTKSL